MNKKQKDLMDELCNEGWDVLLRDIHTDASPDYRQGFVAGGVLAMYRCRNILVNMEHEHE